MEKLTDAEVIERFKATYEQYKLKGDFRTPVYFEVLDLINRNDELIKNYEETLLFARKTIKHQEKKIARLKAEIRNTDNALASLDRPLIEVKYEAYRELAGMVKEEILKMSLKRQTNNIDTDIGYIECAFDSCNLIDNLLKELTEGNT